MISEERLREIYDSWVAQHGLEKLRKTFPFFENLRKLYDWCVDVCEKKGEDPQELDFEAYVDPLLTIAENKSILASMIIGPPEEEEYEQWYEIEKAEIEKRAREAGLFEQFEKDIEKLEREVRKYRKRYEEAKQLESKYEREAERQRQEKEAIERRVSPIRIRFLKDFEYGIMRYKAGDVAEIRDLNWALALIERKIAERVGPEVPIKITPPPEALPPEVKPPKVPPPKVLPPIPEVCPHDGSPLVEMTRVPLLIMDPLRLTAEEEYYRAATGLPMPTRAIEWIDVPPTMRVWMCERGDHYFERDAAGKPVERPPEYIYKKLIREVARFRRIEAPPIVPAELVPPEVRTRFLQWVRRWEAPVGKKAIQLHPKDWLLTKGIAWGDFLKLPDAERKRLLDEYEEEVSRGLGR